MNPIGWAAPSIAKLRFLIGPSGIELPKIPTPAGMSMAAARPSPAQHPMSPFPDLMKEVVMETEEKTAIPSRKIRLLPNASDMAPMISRKAPLTRENMDSGHDSSSCDRLTDLAMDGSATVRAPLKNEVKTVTPLMEVSERMIRASADSLGGVRMFDSFLEDRTPLRNSDKLLDRCMLILYT